MAQPGNISDRDFRSYAEDPASPGDSRRKVLTYPDTSAPATPVMETPKDSVYLKTPLLNAGSEAMNVDGTTPVHFDFSPTGTQQVYLESLTLFIEDAGSTDIADFGAIVGSLTNGLRILLTKSATDYEIANMKNNRQLFSVFSAFPALQSAGAGWFNSQDNFGGTLLFGQAILLNGSTDRIRVTVRDNLSTLDALSVFASLRRVL
jgi:hypothetical protein